MQISQFSIKETLNDIPPGVKTFAIRALIILAVWLALNYLVFKPTEVPDKWLSNITARSAAKIMSACCGGGFTTDQKIEYVNGVKQTTTGVVKGGYEIFYLNDGCDALDLFALYVSFLLCLPTTLRRASTFAILGVIAIFILNILRCCALLWLQMNERKWVDFAHHYLFTLIVYAFIFGIWVWYAKKYKTAKE